MVPIPPNVKLLLYAGAAALMFGAGWKVAGWRGDARLSDAKLDWATLEMERTNAALEQQKRDLAALRKVDTVYVQGAERVRTETKLVTKEVIRYVQRPVEDRVVLPAEWVRVHDLAATGVPATGAAVSSPDGGAQAVTDVDALPVVTANYNECRGYIEQVKGLQAYANSLQRPQKE